MANDYPVLPHAKVVPVYTRIAPFHDLHSQIFESRALRRAFDLGDVVNGSAVLEVGVGTGLLFSQIVAANPDGWTLGIERTPAMLQRAHERMRGVERSCFKLVEADLYDITLPNQQFDYIFSTFVLDLLPDEDHSAILNIWFDALKPDGRLILAGMTRGWRWYHAPWMLLPRLHPSIFGGCRPRNVRNAVVDAGFTLTHHERMSQATFPSEIVSGVRPA